MRELLKLYFIMGTNNCRQQPLQVLKDAIAGGITLFQFREKGANALTGEAKYQFAKKAQALCQQAGVPFIVNDDVDLALALDADGVHVGQDDEMAANVRKKIGDKILGVSVHNLEQTRLAIEQGADYVGLGPVFPTNTKADAKAVQGTTLIKSLVKNNIQIPIVGIGGITPKNAKEVMAAGADGVSVITAISLADSVFYSTKKLKEAVLLNN
ncbi:thiamine phosphate synthase [Peptococcaceae bacterium 1198_IL3148]